MYKGNCYENNTNIYIKWFNYKHLKTFGFDHNSKSFQNFKKLLSLIKHFTLFRLIAALQ